MTDTTAWTITPTDTKTMATDTVLATLTTTLTLAITRLLTTAITVMTSATTTHTQVMQTSATTTHTAVPTITMSSALSIEHLTASNQVTTYNTTYFVNKGLN